MIKNAMICIFVFCVLWTPVWAQREGGQQPSSSEQGQQTQQPAERPNRQRPLFLSGKVILADGREPGEQVRIELICQGTVMRQEYTAHNGTFSMELNQANHATLQPLDASISSTGYSNSGGGFDAGLSGNTGLNRGSTAGQGSSQNLSSCEIQAQLAGHRSDIITLGPRRVLDSPDIGVIVLHRLDGRDGGTISLNTLSAPKDARKAYEKAGKELIKKKPNLSKATKELEKAVKIYNEFAAAWFMLGEVRLAQNDRSKAREAYQQAVAADADYLSPRVSLALMSLEKERWEEAAQFSDEALEINPNHLRAHYFRAVANSSLGNVDAAEASALRVQESDEVQNYPLIHYVMGWIMSQRGDFDSAAAEFRFFVEAQPEARLAERLRKQLADWVNQGLIQESGS